MPGTSTYIRGGLQVVSNLVVYDYKSVAYRNHGLN